MNKLFIITRREYMSIVGSKSFLVMTILSPLILLMCIGAPIVIEHFNNQASEQEVVTVIDQSSQRYGLALKNHDQYKYVQLTANPGDNVDAQRFYNKADGQTSAVVVIPHDVDSTLSVTVYSDNTISAALKDDIATALGNTLTSARIASYGIPRLQQIMSEANVDVNVRGVKWNDDGKESDSSTEAAMVFGMILAFVVYVFILTYGAMVMNSVVEEKTNRIVEVIVSSCKPFQLMMGKIIGVGLAGITQFVIWAVALALLGFAATVVMGDSLATAASGAGDAEFAAVAMQAALSINYLPILLCFVFYFVGGYLLYASLFSAFGSAVDQASDASQIMGPIMLFMIMALYAGMACMQNPNGPMAVWCSMIPFTSPIVMMVRLPYDVPMWQLAVSIGLLFATAAAITYLSGRIYRTGILLYGKKHSLAEIVKWMRRG